ncbi:MAG: DUF2269 domain-containing protein [Rhodobacteraceae bacterium]|jgi:uncharacterized membrane protein|nr:DUF2269 domain-containing protein [Paracoccaceae bacterium]
MDTFTLFKTLHVAAAIVWIGGGVTLAVGGAVARRSGSAAQFVAVGRLVALLGPRVFLPASIATLVFGLLMVWTGGLAWDAWLVLGLAGAVATALFGTFVLKPRAEAIGIVAGVPHRREDAVRLTADLLRLASVDYVILFTVVTLMVVKPGWSDTGLLAGMAALAGASAAVLLALQSRRPAAVC